MSDLVKVVRCKDCTHYCDNIEQPKYDCEILKRDFLFRTDYCSYGKRKKDER